MGDFGAPLAEYRVLDDVVVAPEFERYLIVAWGDRVFDDRDQYVGYNADYTAFRRLRGSGDGFLWVNHEYISFPLSLGAPETPATLQTANPRPATSFPAVVGFDIDGPTVPQGPAGASSSTTWAARSCGSARATAAATPPWPIGATAASTACPGWPSTPAAATCAPTAHPSRRWCRGATVPTSRATGDT